MRVEQVKQYAGIAAGSLGFMGGRAPVGPLHAQIGISDHCNHRCVMCWDHPPEDRQSPSTAVRFGFKPPDFMSLKMFQSIVDDLYRLGTRRVDLVGRGEPLLNPAAVEIVAHAKMREMLVILCTNAARLTPAFSDRFVALGLDRLNVSLNAGTPETYPHIHVTESPADYLHVKKNLSYLSSARDAAGKTSPHIRLSFVIGSKNFFEIDAMVRVTKEVGANEAMFVHTVTHEGTQDLALNPDQYQELLASVARAKTIAAELDVVTNLATFTAIVPTYLKEHGKAPTVVPCYAGWYFANILANGSVMPCCQCRKPIDRVSDDHTFGEIWASQNYREFRVAAKNLPMASDRLSTCECDRCMLRPRNLSIHNLLHPLGRIDVADDQLFTFKDLLGLRKVDRP